jgi:hypothetical protein
MDRRNIRFNLSIFFSTFCRTGNRSLDCLFTNTAIFQSNITAFFNHISHMVPPLRTTSTLRNRFLPILQLIEAFVKCAIYNNCPFIFFFCVNGVFFEVFQFVCFLFDLTLVLFFPLSF